MECLCVDKIRPPSVTQDLAPWQALPMLLIDNMFPHSRQTLSQSSFISHGGQLAQPLTRLEGWPWPTGAFVLCLPSGKPCSTQIHTLTWARFQSGKAPPGTFYHIQENINAYIQTHYTKTKGTTYRTSDSFKFVKLSPSPLPHDYQPESSLIHSLSDPQPVSCTPTLSSYQIWGGIFSLSPDASFLYLISVILIVCCLFLFILDNIIKTL